MNTINNTKQIQRGGAACQPVAVYHCGMLLNLLFTCVLLLSKCKITHVNMRRTPAITKLCKTRLCYYRGKWIEIH